MRVIAGTLGGRTFESPLGGRTHPMAEKARGALFNVLGDIVGLRVLDAFAGSGALSIEAASRGAKHVIAIDIDKSVTQVITSNVNTLRLNKAIKVVRANVRSWSDNNPDLLFDVVLCDPPYDDIDESILIQLASHATMNAIIVFSLPPTSTFVLVPAHFQLLSKKSYGDIELLFYRRLA